MKTLCLIGLLVVAVSAWPGRGSEERDEREEMSPRELMEKVGKLVGLENLVREKAEYELWKKKDKVEMAYHAFMKYAHVRKAFEVMRFMKDKPEVLKMAMKHFMEKMDGKPKSWGSDEDEGMAEPEGSMEREEDDDSEEKKMGKMGGKMREAGKLQAAWKAFVQFELAFIQQNKIMAMGLDEKTKMGLFFETFLRFSMNVKKIKKQAENMDKIKQFVEYSKKKAKGMKDEY